MDFDHDGEFDRIMEEIHPMSIPATFVRQVVVKMKNGQQISLSGDELLQPLQKKIFQLQLLLHLI